MQYLINDSSYIWYVKFARDLFGIYAEDGCGMCWYSP